MEKMNLMNKKRYQECSWLRKRLRDIWLISIPFISIYYYVTRKRVYHDKIIDGKLVHTDEYEIMSWKLCRSIARGDVDNLRNFYYTHEEVIENLKNKCNYGLANRYKKR